MTIMRFCSYLPCKDGYLASMETTGEDNGIPVNIFADDGSDFQLQEGALCAFELYGMADQLQIYLNKDIFNAVGTHLAHKAMIPIGTFPPDAESWGDDDYPQSPLILFTGIVREVERDSDPSPDGPDCCVTVETLAMTLHLFVKDGGVIEEGNVLYGQAWLYADIRAIS